MHVYRQMWQLQIPAPLNLLDSRVRVVMQGQHLLLAAMLKLSSAGPRWAISEGLSTKRGSLMTIRILFISWQEGSHVPSDDSLVLNTENVFISQ